MLRDMSDATLFYFLCGHAYAIYFWERLIAKKKRGKTVIFVNILFC